MARFDLVVLVDTGNKDELEKTVESCIDQSNGLWRLILVHPKRLSGFVGGFIKRDDRITSRVLSEGGFAESLNEVLVEDESEYVGILDLGGFLKKHCLREISSKLDVNSKRDVLYTDHELVHPDSLVRLRRVRKPVFSPDNLLVGNYLARFTVIRKSCALKRGGFNQGLDFAYELDLYLRLFEAGACFSHIKYAHYRIFKRRVGQDKLNSRQRQETKEVISNALVRRGISGKVRYDRESNVFRIRYMIAREPLVSIIIPFRDKLRYLKTCLNSIFEKTSYRNFEIILVDNNSQDGGTLNYLKEVGKRKNVKVLKYGGEFNFSAINNFAVGKARGEYILLLNNDVKVRVKGWIEEMLGLCMQKHVGVVGAKLLYPDGSIQHAGVYLKHSYPDLIFWHILRGEKQPDKSVCGLVYEQVRDCTAVTAACMMFEKRLYEKLGGLDEKLKVCLNDVDFCLKLLDKGYSVAYTPYARLTHFEGISRGDLNQENTECEVRRLNRRWQKKLTSEQYYLKDENPRITVLMHANNLKEKYITDSIESVLSQTYSDWELFIADYSSEKSIQKNVLKKYSKQDHRIRFVSFDESVDVSNAFNSLVEFSTGDFLSILKNGDLIVSTYFSELDLKVVENPRVGLIYTDEAKIREGDRCILSENKKPDWSPDYMLTSNYVGDNSTVSRWVFDRIGGFREGLDGFRYMDLNFRASSISDVDHVRGLCVLKRFDEKEGGGDIKVAKKIVEETLERRGIDAKVDYNPKNEVFRFKYNFEKEPLVSIIIPFKDKTSVLKRCLDSLFEKTSYSNFEILLIDNGSTEVEMKKYFGKIRKNKKIRIIRYPREFNFAAISNFGVRKARGDYILFLNNDVKIVVKDWIEEMLGLCMQKHVGVVGAKLVFPNGKLQHTGTYLLKDRFDNIHFRQIDYNRKPETAECMKPLTDHLKNTIAVTGACMMIRREVYDEVSGMDEKFKVFFNDTDLCLKAMKKGYHNVYTPYSKIVHYEATSRKGKFNAQIMKEYWMMHKRWNDKFEVDPYYYMNCYCYRMGWGKQ